jgi:hypothetical protein
MEKMDIKRVAGKWLLNGKQYFELEGKEKTFFDEFIIAMRLMKEMEKPKASA